MGESPATAFELAPVVDRPQTDADSLKSARELLDIAQREHPSVVAARAQIDAARAKVDQARSQGMPTLTFSGRANYSTQPVSPSLGSPELPAFGRDRYFGLQLDIPIFEGFTRTYQIREAEARVEVQQATLADAEMQVAQAVWQSYQTLQTAAENLTNSATLLESARQSFEASQHRYESGVGNILELLTAQTAFANAQQQRVQALTDWRIGKVQLVGSLGRLILSREAY
jgi:outer membrane protein